MTLHILDPAPALGRIEVIECLHSRLVEVPSDRLAEFHHARELIRLRDQIQCALDLIASGEPTDAALVLRGKL